MNIHASTKMDIAPYIEWLSNRLHEGYFDRELNEKIVNRYLLKDIDELILYTRDPSKVYRNSDLLTGHAKSTALVSFMTQYDSLFEPKLKQKDKVIEAIMKGRRRFDRNYFGYGPVFLTSTHDREWHLSQFSTLCRMLSPYIDGAYVSFRINERCQNARNMKCSPIEGDDMEAMLADLMEIGSSNRVSVQRMRYEDELCEDELDIGEANCCPNVCEYCPYIYNKQIVLDKYRIYRMAKEKPMLYGTMASTQRIAKVDIPAQMRAKEEPFACQMSLMDFMA